VDLKRWNGEIDFLIREGDEKETGLNGIAPEEVT
jgi:hypothetical protein